MATLPAKLTMGGFMQAGKWSLSRDDPLVSWYPAGGTPRDPEVDATIIIAQ